jgi:hypothetical protein
MMVCYILWPICFIDNVYLYPKLFATLIRTDLRENTGQMQMLVQKNHDSFVYCQLFLTDTSNFLKRTVPGFENHIPLISYDRLIDYKVI